MSGSGRRDREIVRLRPVSHSTRARAKAGCIWPVVLDLASRRIVGWSMSERMHGRSGLPGAEVGLLATQTGAGTDHAFGPRQPVREWIVTGKLIADYRMLQSMSRKANCWDNAPMESFFKTLKVERVYQLRYQTRAQARLDIVDWIEGFYNHRRFHSSIGYQIPARMESRLMAA